MQLDVRMRAPEAVQAGCKPTRDVRRNAGNANMSAFAPVDAGNRVTKLKQSTPDAGRKPCAFRRYLDASGVAHEQRGAELFFEGGDAMADGAGRHAQLVARIFEAFVPLDGFKHAQRFEGRQTTHRHLLTAPDLWSRWQGRSVAGHA